MFLDLVKRTVPRTKNRTAISFVGKHKESEEKKEQRFSSPRFVIKPNFNVENPI